MKSISSKFIKKFAVQLFINLFLWTLYIVIIGKFDWFFVVFMSLTLTLSASYCTWRHPDLC